MENDEYIRQLENLKKIIGGQLIRRPDDVSGLTIGSLDPLTGAPLHWQDYDRINACLPAFSTSEQLGMRRRS